MLTAGLIHQRRLRQNAPSLEADHSAAERAMRARIRLAHLIRALGAQRLGAWQQELMGFTECAESINHLSASETRLRLATHLDAPSEVEREIIVRNASQISARDRGVQAQADAEVQDDHHATAAILAEMGMTERALRERLSRMERRRIALEDVIPRTEARVQVIKREQYLMADPIRESGEALNLLQAGEDDDAIWHHQSTRAGMMEELRQLRLESARHSEALPVMRAEQAALNVELDELLDRMSGRFEYEVVAGVERPRLLLPTDEDRGALRQWQDDQDRNDLAEIALTAIAPASAQADDAITNNDTIRWVMLEDVSEDVGAITVLGGLALTAETHRATLTGKGGDPVLLSQVVRSLSALERVLREWLHAIEVLRIRAGKVNRALKNAVHCNASYKTMVATPLPGALFGPRVFVWRSHQFARALLLLVDGEIVTEDGRLARDVPARLSHAKTALRLDGWH
jgi:hypothetical protein